MNIPKDKDYPDGAGQCHDCGGHGCATCDRSAARLNEPVSATAQK